MTRKVTMQEIANHLNISKNSVSQALTGKPGVSEETRKRVQQAAQELGYEYPKSKTVLKTRKQTKDIALIASDFAFSAKSFFGEIYLSIEKEARKRNLNLFIQPINKEAINNLELPSFIEDRSVDGVLILSHLSTAYIQKVTQQDIPTVLIDHHHPFIHADAILTNNRFGAYTAVHHLIEQGHKNIAFVGNINYSPSYRERLDGYLLALEHSNIEVNPAFLLTDITESEEVVWEQLTNLPSLPTAWFCVNDGLGFFVNSCLQRKGIQIPSQASICSFDNGLLSRMTTPKITTVDIDLELYGKKAVEQLFWRFNHRDEPFQEILLSTKLMVRESTGTAPI
ncbi:LacI family DNA-binding transcriptional regulator [Bacillus sp. DX1.1]|uniref:LacI family DNA-binding transcriptional regulator n=1 Tax=unclassified Bacillus (in: firmicutes) TaxID=185979 RepID=UPI0025703AC2|nr:MULTISPECIES: LacI family DNA-binding transcriptional regulator [unclassified Bacillus (in: firmicutes)]MDM5153108.1 LacI family DNA-binding transcriptional regulator [Bacillus sp. DX1.1]WJE82081.1 LacI family DNA-binding transcriptional regulator [Bacillus sp. DX3.1]